MRALDQMLVPLLVSLIGLSCTAEPTTEVTGPAPVASVSVEPADAVLTVGAAAQLAAVVRDAFGDTLAGRVTVWTSTDEGVASILDVAGPGAMVSGVAPGSAMVIGTTEGKSDTAVISVTSVAPPNSTTPLTFLGDFENGFSGWNTSEACCSYSHSIVHQPVRSGSNALRIELRRNDPQVALGPRSELIAFDGSIPTSSRTAVGGIGDEAWWGFSVYVPLDWIDDSLPEIVHQIHEQPDPGETWRSPPLALQISGANWEVWSRWDDNPLTVGSSPVGKQDVVLTSAVRKGRWTDWVFHVRWSYLGDGLLEIWRDGSLVVQRVGPNYYNDQRSGYLKLGIYKWPWKAPPAPTDVLSRVIFYDDLRIAGTSGSYALVAPR